MGESPKAPDAVDTLVKAVGGKLNGLRYDVLKRTVLSGINMRHSGVSDILEGRPCPEPIYSSSYNFRDAGLHELSHVARSWTNRLLSLVRGSTSSQSRHGRPTFSIFA